MASRTTISRWLGSPPSATLHESPPLARPSEKLNALRIAPLMGTAVTAVFVAPSVMQNTDAHGLPRMVAAISAEYGDRTGHSMKTVVEVDSCFEYNVDGIPWVSTSDCIAKDTKVLFMDAQTAAKASQFGNAVVFFYVKRGPCIDYESEQKLRAIARGVRSERFHRLVILCDAPSSIEERRRLGHLFDPLEMTYGEITYDDPYAPVIH